ncbi:3-deoxy-D-manno-octulosonic acid transferase [Flavimaricola marinus]|uniref:3-deoxy-D-manno-octulosonic acid transferase n=1 Tax=Flavimaricola marinus TaxID=1819565 RepID=A0A238LDS6_9RHOB|nr:3-deoxy-D-manno-octulosonic acid transferase [Flavimaricola marinus]SMY07768.1 3-deoxy-D-manno-octulosonic acid transferase [Flavimaricola marinus]
MTTLPLRLYSGLANLSAPLLSKRISDKLTSQGISAKRAAERFGQATKARPAGPLAWVHAASVGESLSALPLIDKLLAERPDLYVLITTGTAASAKILAERLPDKAFHQFAPLDSKSILTRFLFHWSPDLLVLVESELWPQLIQRTAARDTPLALINARMSQGSLRNWARFGKTARELFSRFSLITAQNDSTAQGLRDLGAPNVTAAGNLKSAAPPLADQPALRRRMKSALQKRPLWLAASTHPGEDELLLATHRALLEAQPDLCLILAPRHPERADKLAAQIESSGLSLTRRSAGELPERQVFLADTLGEMGLWFRLAPVTFMGGSLTPNGGHNPWEGAALGTALLTGPNLENCRDDWATLSAAGAAKLCRTDSLQTDIGSLLLAPDQAKTLGANALKTYRAQANSLTETASALLALLPAKGTS